MAAAAGPAGQQRGSHFLAVLLEWLWPLALQVQQCSSHFLMTQRSPSLLTMEVQLRGLRRLISGVSRALTAKVQRHNAPFILM